MASSNLPVNVYQNFNRLVDNATGAGSTSLDLSTTITVGQAAQMYGYENTLNKLSLALGRVLMAVRPYRSRFGLIESDPEEYGQYMRKISYFSGAFEDSQDWNTTQTANKLVDGQVVDHYKIRKRYPLEVWFGGNKVLQKHYTRFRKQLKLAFSNAEDFARFYEGEAVQLNNEIQMLKEIENRAVVLNGIAGCYAQTKATATDQQFPAGMARNMTKEYNEKYGTKYTTAQLLTTYLKEFTQFFVSELKYQSDLLEQATELYHVTPRNVKGDGDVTLHLWRHTPKAEQRLMLASNVLYDMESMVFPEIFHDGYLRIENYEAVPFWSTPSKPLNVPVEKANVINPATGASIVAAVNMSGAKVLGVLFDRWAITTCYHQEDVVTTPVNAAGDYYNTFYHWCKDYRNDFTENMVLFYMEDVAAQGGNNGV